MKLMFMICCTMICVLVIASGQEVMAREPIANTPFVQDYREAFIQVYRHN